MSIDWRPWRGVTTVGVGPEFKALGAAVTPQLCVPCDLASTLKTLCFCGSHHPASAYLSVWVSGVIGHEVGICP